MAFYCCSKCKYYGATYRCNVRHIYINTPETSCCEYFRARESQLVKTTFKPQPKKEDKTE